MVLNRFCRSDEHLLQNMKEIRIKKKTIRKTSYRFGRSQRIEWSTVLPTLS